MKTIEDIKQVKYELLTSGNTLRGYSNIKDYENIKRLEKIVDGLENKLNNFKIDDDLKDAYIISEFNKIVEDICEDELNELINDDYIIYYSDCNISCIYDFLYNLFDESHTINEIDDTIILLFGYYSYNRLVELDGQIYVILIN